MLHHTRVFLSCFIFGLSTSVYASISDVKTLDKGSQKEQVQFVALPNFAHIMRNESHKVVHINAVQKWQERALSPMELFRQLLPPEQGGMTEKERRRNEQREEPQTGIGSGFFISPEGHILTNAHLVNKAETVTVKVGKGRPVSAKIVGLDLRTDIAVLKIESFLPTPTVRIGNPEHLSVGDWVVAIGSPFGFENTMTSGIVSAKRTHLADVNYLPFIQTDVAINPGNSGGPLLNVLGEVVGINTQIYTRSGGYMGMSFSIPIDAAMSVARILMEKGTFDRSRIGVRIDRLTIELAEALGVQEVYEGVVVLQVDPSGPAHKAKMRPGDVVVSVNEKVISSPQELTRYVSESTPGSTLNFDVWRLGEKLTLPVQVVAASSISLNQMDNNDVLPQEQDSSKFNSLGLSFVKDTNVIEDVHPDVKDEGIKPGDVLVQLQQHQVLSKKDIDTWLKNNTSEKVGVFLQRSGKSKFVILERRSNS